MNYTTLSEKIFSGHQPTFRNFVGRNVNLQYNTHIKTRTKKLDHTNKTAATVLKFKYRILSSCYMQTEGATAVRCCYWKHTRTQAQQYIHRHTRPYVSRRHTDAVNICNVWQTYPTAQPRTKQCCTWETLHSRTANTKATYNQRHYKKLQCQVSAQVYPHLQHLPQ